MPNDSPRSAPNVMTLGDNALENNTGRGSDFWCITLIVMFIPVTVQLRFFIHLNSYYHSSHNPLVRRVTRGFRPDKSTREHTKDSIIVNGPVDLLASSS